MPPRAAAVSLLKKCLKKTSASNRSACAAAVAAVSAVAFPTTPELSLDGFAVMARQTSHPSSGEGDST